MLGTALPAAAFSGSFVGVGDRNDDFEAPRALFLFTTGERGKREAGCAAEAAIQGDVALTAGMHDMASGAAATAAEAEKISWLMGADSCCGCCMLPDLVGAVVVCFWASCWSLLLEAAAAVVRQEVPHGVKPASCAVSSTVAGFMNPRTGLISELECVLCSDFVLALTSGDKVADLEVKSSFFGVACPAPAVEPVQEGKCAASRRVMAGASSGTYTV